MPSNNGQTAALHAHFLKILPEIELHARTRFSDLKCPGKRDDAVAEAVAISWKWFLRLAHQNKNVDEFVATLAHHAVRHVRRLCGQGWGEDALSPHAKQQNITVGPIANGNSLQGNNFDDALTDNNQSPVDEQVAFKLDFAAWLQTYDDRSREVIYALMRGEHSRQVGHRYDTDTTPIPVVVRSDQSDIASVHEPLAAVP